MVYPFQSRGLFYVAAFICFISVFMIPVGVVFVVMARRARIEITDTEFVYAMLSTKRILFTNISGLALLPQANARLYQGTTYIAIQAVHVWPLEITYEHGKKLKLSLNHFAKPDEILKVLQQKSGRTVEDRRGIVS